MADMNEIAAHIRTITGELNAIADALEPSVEPPVTYPIPAPATALTTVRLIAEAGFHPYCIGQAFSPGDLTGDLDGLQATVKSRWPDGSVKFAILAGVIDHPGGDAAVEIGAGTAAPGEPITTAALAGITASVLTEYGEAFFDNWLTPFAQWASGPLMSSWVYRQDIDDHLTAWLEVRAFATGDVDVLPWIENGYLLKAGPSDRPGEYVFTLNGVERFRRTLPVYHHTRAPLVDGALLSHWAGSAHIVTPKHDSAYLASTGLVQAYMAEAQKDEVAALPASRGVPVEFVPYTPMSPDNTNHSPAMGMPGGHQSIGVQPGWEATALTCASARAFEQMIRESYQFGQYHIHYRDEATSRPLRFTQHPDTQIDSSDYNAMIGDVQAGPGIKTPLSSGATGQKWKVSHAPASPLLAYLTTGRYWFMEECQFITTADYLSINVDNRLGSGFKVSPNGQQTRSAAWMIRNLFIAACVTPDDDALKPDMDAAIETNVDYFHTKYVERPSNPFGMVETGTRNAASIGGAQAWQYDFWIGAWGRGIAFGLCGQKGIEFFDWLSRCIVGRLGGTAENEWLYRCATGQAPEGSRVPFIWPGSGISMAADGQTITGTPPDYENGTGPWWESWGALYDHCIVGQDGFTDKTDGVIGGGFIGDQYGWWGNLMQSIMAAASLGAPGARVALDRLRAAEGWDWWADQLAGYDGQPTNALDYVALLADRSAPAQPVAGEGSIVNVNQNSASEVDYDFQVSGANGPFSKWWNGYGMYRSFSQMVGAWSGGIHAPEYGEAGAVVVFGGGHGANQGHFVYLFDLAIKEWKQIGAPQNLPDNFDWAGFLSHPDRTYTPEADLRDPEWLDYEYNGSLIKLTDHTYNTVVYVSPTEGGGPQGSLLLPSAPKTENPSQFPSKWSPHLLDLETGKITRALSAPPGLDFNDDGKKAAIKDTKRNKVWYLRDGSNIAHCHDLNTTPHTFSQHVIRKTNGQGTDTWIPCYGKTWVYVKEADALVQVGGYGTDIENRPGFVYILDMKTGVPVDIKKQNATGIFKHGGYSPAVAWCPTQQALYVYEGCGDDFCTVIRPSSLDFTTAEWSWSRERFTGETPVSRFPGIGKMTTLQSPFQRFIWSDALECFVWHDGPNMTGSVDGVQRDGIVQLWKPPGIVISDS